MSIKKLMNIKQKIAVSYHPGVMLQEKLEELGMPIKTFAERCGKPETTILCVINRTKSMTSEMAIDFEKVLGIPAHMWLRMQVRYDEHVAKCDGLA
jgi:addiction module HigA family antidote